MESEGTPAQICEELAYKRIRQGSLNEAIQRLKICAEQGMIGVVLSTDDRIDGLTCEELAAQGFTLDQVEVHWPKQMCSSKLIVVCW